MYDTYVDTKLRDNNILFTLMAQFIDSSLNCRSFIS